MTAAGAQSVERCFLSYSRTDSDVALRLANDLEALGVALWVDRRNIRPSEHWDRAIERAIRGCRCMVVVLSPRAAASENVADEISLAIDSAKRIIPVMIEPCSLPLRLTRLHLIDATGGFARAVQQCFAEIASGEADHDRLVPQIQCGIDDPQLIACAERELARFVGPIAQILVQRAAARAATAEGLYHLLALHIDHEPDRQQFIAAGSVPAVVPGHSATARQSIHRSDLERIAHALASHLGPIALVLTNREGAAAASLKDLLGRLASRIEGDDERADFLRQVQTQPGPAII
ncbi:MAG: toll/interleukin-1 receptor domain-containing protein [Sphingomicrobium sp.]